MNLYEIKLIDSNGFNGITGKVKSKSLNELKKKISKFYPAHKIDKITLLSSK